MFRQKELILFDFDGTLIDSVPDLAAAINHLLQHLGRDGFDEDRIRSWVGNGARALVERALRASYNDASALSEGLVDEALEIFLAFYAGNLAVNTVTYPHVPEILHRLRSLGFRMAIVTNKPHAFIDPILESLGMEEFFECKLGGDSLPYKKPNPAPLLHVCDTLGVDRDKCVMIGDSKNDILAAKAADMHCIGLGYGYNYGEDIGTYGPDLIFHDFKALAEVFGVADG